MKEFLTFGGAARLYATLDAPIRENIAKTFGVPKLPVFDNWVVSFVDLRNFCAHHDRLFNRRFQKQLQRLPRESIPTADNNTLKALFESLDFVLASVDENVRTVDEAHRIMDLSKHAAINPAEVGY